MLRNSLISFLLLTISQYTFASVTCPRLDQISHTPGEYSWNTTVPGWEGQFVAPTNGRGYSTKIERFSQARWIQFSNLPSSPGYVQCDYIGNIGENEVIRFTQQADKATKRPEGDIWTKIANVKFPSIQRECGASVELCRFDQL